MGGLPKKALKIGQLKILTVGSVDGSHKISRVSFIEDNIEKVGFYKELAPQKDYPELLAKMSVAASLFGRLFLGKKIAEERLVCNEKKQIIGTLSIGIDGFKPLNFAYDNVPEDTKLKEQVKPSTKTLIEYNMMELLVKKWMDGDDDVHPGNLSLFGNIDFDMCWYWFTIHMKGARVGIGNLNTKRINLTVNDWEHFPNVKDAKPYHWPTYKHPGQELIQTIIPLQKHLLDKVLPKAYPDPTQFENLAGESVAQEQKFAAALQALLTFQPVMVRQRLAEHFGDMPLNYSSLAAISEELCTTYEDEFPRFCNKESDKQPFIDFIMTMYQEHYDNLYRVVVFYMGCENNGYGVSLPATYDALYRKPSFYTNILEWAKKENETTYSEDEENIRYDEDELQSRYHQVWRDAFAPTLKELLYKSYEITTKLLIKISSKTELTKFVGKNINDITLTKSWEFFGTLPELSLDKIELVILVDENSSLREALSLLIEFTNELNQATKKYYEQEWTKLTEKDNTNFVEQLGILYSKYNLNIRKNLAFTGSFANEFNLIAEGLKLFTSQADFQVHLTTTDEQMKDVKTIKINKEMLSHTHEDSIKQFNTALFLWARSLKADDFNDYITDIIDKKYVSIFSNRSREKPVKEYLLSSTDDSGDYRLAYILSTGNEEGALNKLLIEHLTPYVMQKHYLPSICNAVKDGSFTNDIVVFTKAAVQFAKYELTKGLNKILFDWIDSLEKSKFTGIIKASLKEYESHLWFSSSRRNEVEEYLKLSSQSKIIAMIFLNGKESSSLNDVLFQKLMFAFKNDISESETMKKIPGYQLLIDCDSKHKDLYFSEIKKFAVSLSHKQEKFIKEEKQNLSINPN